MNQDLLDLARPRQFQSLIQPLTLVLVGGTRDLLSQDLHDVVALTICVGGQLTDLSVRLLEA